MSAQCGSHFGKSPLTTRSIGMIVSKLYLCFMLMSGCAGDLSQSFEQSLTIITPQRIDFAEINYYAIRSKSAYDPIDDIRRAFPLTTHAVTIKSVNVRYFIETDLINNRQTLTVRGTAVKQNVWEDIETTLVPDSILGIPLHRGFQRDATAIFDDSTPHIRKDMPLHITGHSLGGAVAMILAAYYDKRGYKVARLVTFGQPKFTSEPPPEKVLSVTTRVVNDLDVVPMIPPHTLARPYEHFSSEIILRDGSDFVFLDEHDAKRISVGDFWRNITDFSLKEHHMDDYLSNIKGKAEIGSRQIPYLFKRETKAVVGIN